MRGTADMLVALSRSAWHRNDLTESAELLRRADELHALGLELSEPAEIALALRPLFPDLATDLLRVEELEAALRERLKSPHTLKE
jgi:LuxR family maltose regulon positive regulatory protein